VTRTTTSPSVAGPDHLYRSSSDGQTWLAATEAKTVTVALETTIVSSADGGSTFATIANMG
jgi:hypothetical protein